MAGETDPHAMRAQEGWKAFSWFLGVSTAAIVVALLLMGFFLL